MGCDEKEEEKGCHEMVKKHWRRCCLGAATGGKGGLTIKVLSITLSPLGPHPTI